MNATIDELVEQVRKELDEVTLAGERVQTDTDLADTASSNFSDQSIKDRLMDGTRYIVSRVKSAHLPDQFIMEVDETTFDPPYDDGTAPKIFRLLGSQVTAANADGDDIRCTRRTFAGHLKMENQRGLVASADYPVFVYQDFELLIENQTTNAKSAQAVKVPDTMPADVVALPDQFRGALIQYAAFSCFQTLRKQDAMENAKVIMQRELQQYRLPFQQAGQQQEDDE